MAIYGITSLTSYLEESQRLTSLISQLMALERRPVTRLETQKDELDIRRGAYSDTQTKLEQLQALAEELAAADETEEWGAIFGGKRVTSSDTSILTASASDEAANQNYEITVQSLAAAHRVRSDRQASSDQALSLAGTFRIGGAATRSTSNEVYSVNTVADFDSASSIRENQRELGSGTYHVEIRDSGDVLQFRLVDDYGNAVSIDDANDTGTAMTSRWQNLSLVAGTTFDTGRGLSIAFAAIQDHSVANEVTIADNIDAFATSEVSSGQTEFSGGTYYVEVRDAGGGDWEFRLVNASGTAQSIYDATADDGSFTSGWQDMDDALANFTGGLYETGRGLAIDFGAGPYQAKTKDTGAAQVDYTARVTQTGLRGDGAAHVDYAPQGASITVVASDTLNSLTSKINGATYAADSAVSASVVDNHLILEAEHAGTAYAIQASDQTGTVLATLGLLDGSAFKTEMRDATDAVFTVNGISVTRSTNTGIGDVISGVTFNLLDTTWDIEDTALAGETYIENSITDFGVGSWIMNGFSELLSGTYYAEVRDAGGGDWEFRLVDWNGLAVEIDEVSGSGTTSGWQDMVDAGAVVDTGRGLTFTIAPAGSYQAGSKSVGTAASVGYTNSLHRSSAEDSQSVKLTISPDTAAITGKINGFLTKLNEVSDYLRAKTMVDPATYARGTLANDSIYSWLRSDLINGIISRPSGLSAEAPESLSEIGITFDDSLHASISDSGALAEALGSNFSGVAELFDTVMQKILDRLESFTDEAHGIIQSSIDSIDDQMDSIEERIASFEKLLEVKEARLRRQFGGMQAQLTRLSQQQMSLELFVGGVGTS